MVVGISRDNHPTNAHRLAGGVDELVSLSINDLPVHLIRPAGVVLQRARHLGDV